MAETTGLREKLENHRALVTVIAVILTLIAVAWVVKSRFSKPVVEGRTGLWFYDMKTGKLFVEPDTTEIPIAVPPSNEMLAGIVPGGVRAHVYSCGDCSKESERSILYLEAYVPPDAALQLGVPSDNTDTPTSIVAKFEPKPRWVRFQSLDGLAIRNEAETHCSGKPATECFPPAPRP